VRALTGGAAKARMRVGGELAIVHAALGIEHALELDEALPARNLQEPRS